MNYSRLPRRTIVVAMSGGVDSSVAAHLLVEKYRNSESTSIVGLFMQNWVAQDEFSSDNNRNSSFCEESVKDRVDAEKVCRHLGIPLHTANFVKEYWTDVFEPFIDGLSADITPNPDILCNRNVKFGAMKDHISQKFSGAQDASIATGHYARLIKSKSKLYDILGCALNDLNASDQQWLEHADILKMLKYTRDKDEIDRSPLLLAALDRRKDQSYFLCGTRGQSLRNVIFPLGDLFKVPSPLTNSPDHDQTAVQVSSSNGRTVRDIAVSAKISTAHKKESMGICFIGKRKFSKFVQQYLPNSYQPGKFLCIDTGRTVGKHEDGLLLTIGQGARISGAAEKWFVCKKDRKSGNVFVCRGTHHPALFFDTFFCDMATWNWVGGQFFNSLDSSRSMRAMCRIRHQQPLVECEIRLKGEQLVFSTLYPLRGVTPGQIASVYILNGNVSLGGGPICRTGASYHEREIDLPREIHPAGLNDQSVMRRNLTV